MCQFLLFAIVICALRLTSGVDHIFSVEHERAVSNKYYVPNWSGKEPYHEISEDWMVADWISKDLKLGQVGGVAVDKQDNVYVFHRADRVWNDDTFNTTNVFTKRYLGPIKTSTVLVFHKNGTFLKKWGENIFYMPHGLTVDQENNLWVTDVALHQVMKFPPSSNSPSFELGEKFVPGRDSAHFCKPTSVAVTADGDIFVADGYCNSRILKFNAVGVKILEWGRAAVNADTRIPGEGVFSIPHALTLIEDKDLLCVADRENGRVQCFHINNGSYEMEISSPMIGSRIFSVTYSQSKGVFFIINGPDYSEIPVRGYVVTPESKILSQFGMNFLLNPHDIAVSSDGNTIYVGEIEPHKIWKFVHNDSIQQNEAVSVHSQFVSMNRKANIGGLAGAVLVTGACLIFAAAIVFLAFVYSRSKKSGCGHCSSNRWLLSNGTSEGFKLGNILGHQGFEKLNTGEESDEEQPLA